MRPAGRAINLRERLRSSGLVDMFQPPIPGLRALTDAERSESLAAALAARPERGDGVWVFAYGSLIWNPALEIVERRVARIHGWHRRFCLSARVGRGTPDAPGLLLGLDRGGACTGVALRIAEELVQEELTILWRREMVAGSYAPRWVRLHDRAGAPFGHAIAFTIRRDGPSYAGSMAEAEVIRRLATAEGEIGSCAEYLLQTRDGLREIGVVDRGLERLAAKVEEVIGGDQLEK